MAQAKNMRRLAYADKTRVELTALADRGVLMSGNAFSSILFVKGELSPEEQAGVKLLSGADGVALKAALASLGYAPEDWVALATCTSAGTPLATDTFREALAALDPATLVLLDQAAVDAMRSAFAAELIGLADFDAAMLEPGVISNVLGMRVMALGGFAEALADDHEKQVMWARLKKIPPLGEPF